MTQKKILIVEDEADIREILRLVLEKADFICFESDNIKDAYIKIIDLQPDLVLLDWMLPMGSGIDLARRLKRDEFTAKLPIIMLTAREEEADKVLGLDSGADDFITLSEDAVAPCMQALEQHRPSIEAGESAVAGLAACLVGAQNPQWRTALGLNEQSKVLVLGTEGATDPELYQQLVFGV